MNRRLLSNRLATAAAFAVVLLTAADAFATRRLHVLVVGDANDPSIGQATAADAGAMTVAFQANVRSAELSLTRMAPDQVSRQNILAAVQRMPIDGDDAVCVYYSGHGAYRNNDATQYLVMRNRRDWLSRSELESAMRQRGAGLTVLITDACFNFTKFDEQVHKAVAPTADQTTPLFKKLFFQSNGYISLNSCQKDELAGCHVDQSKGSLFTAAFSSVLEANRYLEGVSWNAIFDQTIAKTQQSFRTVFPSGQTVETNGDFKLQRTQTPVKLAFQVQAYTPPDGSGSIRPQPGPQRSESTEYRIDADNGNVYETKITRIYYPNTGRTEVRGSAPRLLEVRARLKYATNGAAYWAYRGEYVKANRPDNGGGGRRYLGVTVVNSNNRGVRITIVNANSPAQNMWDSQGNKWRLEPGDHILSIGGRATNDEASFVQAVRNGPPKALITIISGSDNRQYTFNVDLTNGGGGGGGGNPQRYLGATVRNALGAGVVVTKVNANSPATRMRDNANNSWTLENGDRILSIGGRATNNENAYIQAVRSGPPRAEITIISGSDGRRYTFYVDIGQGGAPPVPNRLRFGAVVVDRGNLAGVQITSVEGNSPASNCRDRNGAAIRLEANDVITHINGAPVNTVAAYQNAVRASGRQMQITLYNSRDGSRMYLVTTLRY